MMRYVEVTKVGPPEVLKISQCAIPQPKSGEVLIKVHTAGINRADIDQRLGLYPGEISPTQILGLEAAGEIVDTGDNVTNFKVGDLVCALTSGGCYAEYVAAPAVQCLPIPKGLSLLEAASLPEVAMTVWSNVFDKDSLKSGQHFLIHGGTSGIGTLAIQLAHAIGATVITTVGNDDKCKIARKLGADLAINYHLDDFEKQVMQFTNNKGVDVILDMVAGEYTAKNIRILAMDGKIAQISDIKGSNVTIDLIELMKRRGNLTGSLLKPRTIKEKGYIVEGVIRDIWPRYENGSIIPIIYRVYPLSEVVQAHKDMEQGGHIGKLLLAIA